MNAQGHGWHQIIRWYERLVSQIWHGNQKYISGIRGARRWSLPLPLPMLVWVRLTLPNISGASTRCCHPIVLRRLFSAPWHESKSNPGIDPAKQIYFGRISESENCWWDMMITDPGRFRLQLWHPNFRKCFNMVHVLNLGTPTSQNSMCLFIDKWGYPQRKSEFLCYDQINIY